MKMQLKSIRLEGAAVFWRGKRWEAFEIGKENCSAIVYDSTPMLVTVCAANSEPLLVPVHRVSQMSPLVEEEE